jgi:hypothetical protein
VAGPHRAPIGRLDRWEDLMIGVALILFAGTIALTALALVLVRSMSLDSEAQRTRLHQPGAETLAYDVPDGQDPADVIAALGGSGYPAVEDEGAGRHQVLVFCPDGRFSDRPRVRALIQGAGLPGSRPVTFADEG